MNMLSLGHLYELESRTLSAQKCLRHCPITRVSCTVNTSVSDTVQSHVFRALSKHVSQTLSNHTCLVHCPNTRVSDTVHSHVSRTVPNLTISKRKGALLWTPINAKNHVLFHYKADNYRIVLRRFSTKDHCSKGRVVCDLLVGCVTWF
jgi:hypothetical protein